MDASLWVLESDRQQEEAAMKCTGWMAFGALLGAVLADFADMNRLASIAMSVVICGTASFIEGAVRAEKMHRKS